MNYNKQEVKEGITLHQIDTKNFKTNLYAIFLATPITRENVTRDALISAVLRRGTITRINKSRIGGYVWGNF